MIRNERRKKKKEKIARVGILCEVWCMLMLCRQCYLAVAL